VIAFLQGLYPPTASATIQTLANGTSQEAPLDGYQYIPIQGLSAASPDIIWIAGDLNCPAKTTASNAYYKSTKFLVIKAQTQSFYNKFIPLISSEFTSTSIGYQSAFNIFDYLNVGYIYNTTIKQSLSADDLFQLRTLADMYSFDLNYNVSSPATSIGGQAIAGIVLNALNTTVRTPSTKTKLTYYAGAYSPMLAFWGITNLTAASSDFYGLPDYASTMTFELRNSSAGDLFVRFGFRNGSLPSAETTYFPMFGQHNIDLEWSTWAQNMAELAIPSETAWCDVCNSQQTFCVGASSKTGITSATSLVSSPKLSLAAAGGIGAGVTIAVIAIVETFIAVLYFSKRRGVSRIPSFEKVGSETGSA
jgi:prostatic acid phosphatase